MSNISAKMAAIGSTLSPYPSSFNGNPWLYGASLASLMTITMFVAIVWGWMIRDLWIDRYRDHPTSPVFMFRLMIAIISFTAFIRCLPEVAYMTCYGEVTGEVMANIQTARQLANVVALPSAVGWATLLVLIYPFVMIALRYNKQNITNTIDVLSVWHRLARPFFILVTILVISSLMAIGKGYVGHGG